MNANPSMRKLLFALSEVPKHLAFNTYIHHGYRSHYSFSECLSSLFFFHNETINVYSHGVMVIYLCVGLPFYLTTTSSQFNILSVINFIACILPFILSTVYHLFLCHKQGACLYNQLLAADLFGIAVVNCFGFVVPMWVTFACHALMRSVCISMYILMSFTILHFFLMAKTAKQRSRPLLGFFFMRLLILATRMFYFSNTGTGDTSAWKYYVLMDIMGVTGASVNIARIPERWFPGKFDYLINSHQLMHFITMVGIWCLNEGSHRDINWLMSNEGQACANDMVQITRI